MSKGKSIMNENEIKDNFEKLLKKVKEYLDYGLPYNEYVYLENTIQTILDLYKKKSRMVEIMAEHLTTDTHGKDWVIKYFESEVDLENGENK